MKQRFILLIFFIISFSNLYSYNKVGLCGNVSFSAQKFEGNTFLIMKVEADKDKILLPETILKIQIGDNSVIRLVGSESTSKNNAKTGQGFFRNTVRDETTNYVVFYISEEQIESLKKGVKRVVINTIPEMYRVQLVDPKDYGTTLYNLLTKIKETDEFE